MPSSPPLQDPETLAVFLDLDGTLVEIAEHPDLIKVSAALRESLQAAYRRLTGALALISGRTIENVDALLAPLKLPVAGIHGLEYRDGNGRQHTVPTPVIPEPAHHRIAALAGSDKGFFLEDKGTSLALHYRQCPEKEDFVRVEMQALLADLGPEFTVQNGKKVAELRPAGPTKGTAVKSFMGKAPFAGRKPVFIGDDITDEDGFDAVNEMGGFSVRVGPGDSGTLARYALHDVAAVEKWLASLAMTEPKYLERSHR